MEGFLKVTILSVGKSKERWIVEGIDEYIKRLKAWGEVEMVWFKTDQDLEQALVKMKNYICLDEKGESFTSPEFASWLQKQQAAYGAHLNFVIGGADGLSKAAKERAASVISFSKMTFTHQMMRLFLVEQLYRAFSLLAGSPYHRA